MIVCSCNVLSDRDVRSAVSAESPRRPRTAGQVYGCLGCSAQCGRCARTIKRIMDEALVGATSEARGPTLGATAAAPCGACPRRASSRL